MTRVELYEVIRREFFVHGRSRRWIARHHQVHRRTVRQALMSAIPPERRAVSREPPVLTLAMRAQIDEWLETDRAAPRKQRHTARRIYQRLTKECDYRGAESTIRRHVGQRRRALGLGVEVYVPQEAIAGEEGQVDWYEAEVAFGEGRRKVQFFVMRASHSGRAFHQAFERQTQQAFLEGHVAALGHFGGVFSCLRYDNLGSAVKRVLRGRRREETARFVGLRSHYLFEAAFCRPGIEGAHEKGGVEGEVGRFRRRHLVPIPQMADMDALNAYLARCCAEDDERRVEEREETVGEAWSREQGALRPLPEEAYRCAEVKTLRVDTKSRIRVGTNHYSVPVALAGRRVEVQVHAQHVVVVHAGREVARHRRRYTRYGESLVLDHYLELLHQKPGALAGSRVLAQARRTGRWPAMYDRLWEELKRRYEEAPATRELLDVLVLHREAPSEAVHQAVSRSLELGCCDAGAIAMLVRQQCTDKVSAPRLEGLGRLARYGQAQAHGLNVYDALYRSALAGAGA